MRSIRSFIDELERAGDLVRVDEYVNPELEITEIADREMKKPGGGKALLFENNGSRYPLIINMYGSESRIAKALYCNTNPSEKSEEMAALFKALSSPKNTFGDKLRTLPLLKDISGYFPKKRKGRGVCQEVVDEEIDVFSLPVLKCWPYDGGKFMTLPMVNTIDPETGIRNVGMYRVQLLDSKTTAMHWHLHKTGARHYQQYKKLGRRMPCAIVLGGDPVYAYCATAPLPDGIDEYLLAGFLLYILFLLLRAMWIRMKNWCWKGLSATILDSIRWRIIIQNSTSRASRTGRTPCILQRLSVCRLWRTLTFRWRQKRFSGFRLRWHLRRRCWICTCRTPVWNTI